jgi:hypothetical protein
MTRFSCGLACSLLLTLSFAGTLAAQGVQEAPVAGQKREAPPQRLEALSILKEHDCALHFIACGQTIQTRLTTNDCQLGDGTYVGFYEFVGLSGQTVTIDMMSTAFDTYLALLDPIPEVVIDDDDGGVGTNSRIVYTLDQSSDEWTIAAFSFLPNTTGPYTLSLQCTSTDGFFSDPEYPDFRFRVRIGNAGEEFFGLRENVCLEDTVCVSGQIPGRSELFLRILGPRPNGFLWPTLVRFTPSRLVVDIRQESTGQLNTYILDAIPPGTEALDGLQDRTGFRP